MPEVMPRPSKQSVLYLFPPLGYAAPMPDDRDSLSPATPEDVADALAFALRFQGRKRIHNADEIMSAIVANRAAANAFSLPRPPSQCP
jgi:hypothetical protein